MLRMVDTFDRVHNVRYWNEITSTIDNSILKNGKVMDLGCGPGLLLKHLVKTFSPAVVTGIDLSEIMLNRAEQELAEFNDIEVNLIQQHLQDDPTLSKDQSAIFSSRVLRSFEDQHVIMNSIWNSLISGGYVVILDWMKADIQTYESWFNRPTNEFGQLSPAQVIKYHRNFSRYNLTDWKYILTSFGFDVVHSFQLDAVHGCTIARKPSEILD